MEGIHYVLTQKEESLKVFPRYFRNNDMATMAYLYDEIIDRVERDLRPNPESIRFLIELVALDTPKAKQLTEKDHADLTLIDEIRQSGFIDRLYKK